MEKIKLALTLSLLLMGCQSEQILSEDIQDRWSGLPRSSGAPTLAIYQVREQGKSYDTDTGLFWKEALSLAIGQYDGIRLVARNDDMRLLLEEQRLLMAGITESEALAQNLGKSLSAEYVLTATLIPTGTRTMDLQYKIISVLSGEIVLTGRIHLPARWIKKSRSTKMREFPDKYYKQLVRVKSRSLIKSLNEYQKKHPRFRVFSAVLGEHKQKNKWETHTEDWLANTINDQGFSYQVNLESKTKTFSHQKMVYKTLDYSLYGKEPYLILFITSREENKLVRVSWQLVTHQLPVDTLCKDEIIIEK